jgi:hypothetical protein
VALLVCVSGLVPGCFYTDPINQRPSVGIVQADGTGPTYRGKTVHFTANKSDPDGEPANVEVHWRAYACTDPTVDPVDGSHDGCDLAPFATDFQDNFTFTIPTFRDGTTTPEQAVLVLLEGIDPLEATAKPVQQLTLNLTDAPPTITPSVQYKHAYVPDAPVNLFAAIGDPDDGIAPPPMVDWTVYTPASQPAYELVDIANIPPDPAHPELLQLGKTFTPHGAGDYTVRVTATDQLGASTMVDIPVEIADDRLPCIAQYTPATAPSGQTLPLTEPTLFEVPVVDDDLDVWPPTDDPSEGVARFSWSILPPGATTRQPLTTVTGNRAALDPASYAPGDIIELRVEIADRIHTVSCPDGDDTCPAMGGSCIQRLTWRVEVH